MKGWGTVDGQVKIEMDHPQQIEPEQVGIHTGDYVEIQGIPPVNMVNTPEIEGGIGTMAMIMNRPIDLKRLRARRSFLLRTRGERKL